MGLAGAANTGLQFRDNLPLRPVGGYGMFFDDLDCANVPWDDVVNLCHECAHAFVEFMGWSASGWHSPES